MPRPNFQFLSVRLNLLVVHPDPGDAKFGLFLNARGF